MRYLLRLLLTLLAGVLYAVGWMAGQGATVALWCWSATATGWDDARGVDEPADAPLKRVA